MRTFVRHKNLFRMNKRRFGRISLLVSASLAVLVAVQAWSLAGVYRDRREEFSRQVMQAMTRAAYDDLLLGNKPTERKSLITFSSSGNIDSIQVDMIQSVSVKNLGGAGKSISFTSKSDTIHHNISVSDGETTRYIRQEIRIPPVYLLQLNMARYDSLLTCNLAAAGIDLPHKVDVVRGPSDSTSSVKPFTAKPLPDSEVVVTALNDSLRIADPLTFTTSLTTDDELYFRLRIENPYRQLLGEMAGVVISSLLMLGAVAGALLYLLRTLFRQKTLEEMRRDLTHNITHELKTPIAVANAANDALLDFGAADDPRRRRRYLTVIRRQLAALSDMVQRILTMSASSSGTPPPAPRQPEVRRKSGDHKGDPDNALPQSQCLLYQWNIPGSCMLPREPAPSWRRQWRPPCRPRLSPGCQKSHHWRMPSPHCAPEDRTR